MMNFNQKREILTRFAELGAMLLPVKEFMHIVFVNFEQEIESELQQIARQKGIQPVENIWYQLEQCIEKCDLEHPILQAVFSNKLIHVLIGPEYTIFNRYAAVYAHLQTMIQTDFHIGLVGCSYGQELIEVRKIVHEAMLNRPNISVTIDVFNKPTPIFNKVKNNIRYPLEILEKYCTANQLATDFIPDKPQTLRFSDSFYQTTHFYEFDLLTLDKPAFQNKPYDLLLIHNVIQYLEPANDQSIDAFQQQAQIGFQWLSNQIKPQGVLSIVNESRKPNTFVAELQKTFFDENSNFTCTQVNPAYLYKKIS